MPLVTLQILTYSVMAVAFFLIFFLLWNFQRQKKNLKQQLAEKDSELQRETQKRLQNEATMTAAQRALELRAKEGSKAYKESEKNLSLLIDGVQNYGLFLINKEGRFISWNSGGQRITGYEEEEVVGQPFSIIFTEEDKAAGMAEKELQDATKFGVAPDERWHVKKDGSFFWATGATNALRDENGNLCGFAKIMGDATERKNAEMALQLSEIRFRALIESMPQLVWSAHSADGIDFLNSKWLQYTGTTLEDNLGMKWLNHVHPEDREKAQRHWDASLQTGMDYEAEYRLRRFDGVYEWHLARGFPVRTQDHIIKWFGSTTYIESQKRAEQTLMEARIAAEEANQAKSSFLANMSHEIRTPLGAILGFAELLAEPGASDEQRSQFAATIQRNGRLLSHLIDDILDLSKVEAGKIDVEKIQISVLDLLAEIDTFGKARADEKAIGFKIEFDGKIPTLIESDPTRIRQVLFNLLGNAIKFTSHGQVSLLVRYNSQTHRICFAITDSGRGISEEEKAKLFKPFEQADNSMTRKYGGTGLGLTLSKRLALILGGDVVLTRSEPGQGSTFTFTLDAGTTTDVPFTSQLDRDSSEHSRKDSKKFLSELRVLVVDDFRDNRFLIEKLLKNSGAEVESATNGIEALAMASKSDFDVILMDLQMPGMDGFTATQKLRLRGNRTPIVALTAHALKGDRDKCLQAGFDEYLTKPIHQEGLLQVLARFSEPISARKT